MGGARRSWRRSFRTWWATPTWSASTDAVSGWCPSSRACSAEQGEGHTTETRAFRQTTPQSSEHLSQLHHQGNCLRDQFVESCVPTKTSLVYESSGWVQGQVSDQPVLPDTQGVISKAIAREACLFVSTTETRRGFHRFALPGLSKHCAAQSKPKQMERVTSESHQRHPRIPPDSRQSHPKGPRNTPKSQQGTSITRRWRW